MTLFLTNTRMKYSRKLVAAAVIAGGLGIGAVGVGTTFAAQATHNGGMSGLVEAIATKFNLNASDVQAVFDEQRTQMEADMAAHAKEELTQAVTDGKLTQAQADAIAAKREELRATKPDFSSTMTDEERRAAMEAQKDSLTQWAKDNNIPMEYLRPAGMNGMHPGPGGKGMHRGFGMHGADTTQTQK